jgi:UPF0716 protein FxsA
MPGCLVVLLALAVPVLDVWLLLRIGDAIGLWQVAALVVAATFLGLSLARGQRALALRSMQSQLRAGAMPAAGLADGPMLMLASLLFLLPGFLTDALGALLLIPPLRRILFALVARRMLRAAREGRVNVRMFGGAFGAGTAGAAGGAASGGSGGAPPGSYEAAREIKELPQDSYRVRGQDGEP